MHKVYLTKNYGKIAASTVNPWSIHTLRKLPHLLRGLNKFDRSDGILVRRMRMLVPNADRFRNNHKHPLPWTILCWSPFGLSFARCRDPRVPPRACFFFACQAWRGRGPGHLQESIARRTVSNHTMAK